MFIVIAIAEISSMVQTRMTRDSHEHRLAWPQTRMTRDSHDNRLALPQTRMATDSHDQRLAWPQTRMATDSHSYKLAWPQTRIATVKTDHTATASFTTGQTVSSAGQISSSFLYYLQFSRWRRLNCSCKPPQLGN